MTAVTISLTRGQMGFKLSDFTIAASAPVSGQEIELRYQLLDANSAALTREDVHNALEAFERLIKEQGLQSPAGTFTLPGLGI